MSKGEIQVPSPAPSGDAPVEPGPDMAAPAAPVAPPAAEPAGEASPEPGGLRYVGEGRWFAGVPARDLGPAEADEHGREDLINSGLYQE